MCEQHEQGCDRLVTTNRHKDAASVCTSVQYAGSSNTRTSAMITDVSTRGDHVLCIEQSPTRNRSSIEFKLGERSKIRADATTSSHVVMG